MEAAREGLAKYLQENEDFTGIVCYNDPTAAGVVTSTNKNLKLEDPRETFSFAFEAEKGERSTKIYRALAYAVDLGADENYIVNLAKEINSYFIDPMTEDRLERTLIIPALRRL